MTPAQQEDVFGASAAADDGEVIVAIDGHEARMSPRTAQRFMFYLARAHQDALYRARKRDPRQTPEVV